MSQLSAELCHLVHLVNALACQEVQTIQVLLIRRHSERGVGLLNRDDSLEDGTFTILNPLTHRVKVGREVNRCREDALAILTLALSIELLPPFTKVMKLGLIVGHNLNLLATLIDGITGSSIDGSWVVLTRYIQCALLLHILSTLHEGSNIISSHSDRQQTYRSEHRETTTHIVRDDEGLVALLIRCGAGSTLLGIGNGHNHLLCLFLTTLVFTHLLQETERDGSLSGSTRLGNVDDTKLHTLQVVNQFREVVLADVVTSKQDAWSLGRLQPAKRVGEGINDHTGTQIGTTNTSHDNSLTILLQHLSSGVQLRNKLWGDGTWQMHPSEEVITCTCTLLKSFLSSFHLRLQCLNSSCLHKGGSFCNVYFHSFYGFFVDCYLNESLNILISTAGEIFS